MATSTVAMARYLMALIVIFVAVAADSPRTDTLENVPDYYTKSAMTLSLNPSEESPFTPKYQVAPLTLAAGLNSTNPTSFAAFHVLGKMVLVDQTNYNAVNYSSSIAYLNCDSNAAESFIAPNDMLEALMSVVPKPNAILLYSTVGSCCSLQGTNLPYSSVWTMLSAADAWQTRNVTADATGDMTATISGNDTSGSSSDLETDGSGNNSAVAMSILYSITGLITLLFLIIIGTGAIRAHRHPERYGPRPGYGGRARQSRARGLARAVLDTLPIVKFGDPQPVKSDPEQELESVSGDQHPDTAPSTAPTEPIDQVSRAAQSNTADGNIDPKMSGAAAPESETPKADGNTEDENLGCSICTDDFTVGEDVRVLPCNHKFHPPCIDPWLVNVSGTCPLCRLDLRPQGSKSGDKSEDEAATSSEPANSGERFTETIDEPEAAPRRWSSFLDWNRLRHAPVDERIQVLRQFREQQDDMTVDGSPEERNRRARFSERLREKFHIRTRTQSARGDGRESESGPAS